MVEQSNKQASFESEKFPIMPVVSIITVVFNGEKYLEQTIQSIVNQTYKNIEYIVIDGGSTDKTLDIIRHYEDSIDYWVSQSDRGLYDAMNKGIAVARGEIIGILNSDDVYFEDTVAEVVRAYLEIQQPCVIYGDMIRFTDEYQTVSLFQGNLSDRAFETASIIINHPTCFVRRSLYENFGTFNLEYEVGADRELMMRFHSQNAAFIKLDCTLAKFRLGGTTSNQSLTNILRREIIQEYRLLNTYAIAKSTIAIVLLTKLTKSLRKWLLYKVLGDKITNQIIMFYVGKKFPNRTHTKSFKSSKT